MRKREKRTEHGRFAPSPWARACPELAEGGLGGGVRGEGYAGACFCSVRLSQRNPLQRGKWPSAARSMGVSVCTAAARSGYGNISFLNRFCDRPGTRFPAIPRGSGVPGWKKTSKYRPVCLIRDKARQNGGKLRKRTTAMEKKLERTIKKERAADLLQMRPFLQSNPFPGEKRPGAAAGMGCPSRLRRNARPSPPHPIVFRASPSEEASSAKEVTLRARPPPPDPLPRRGGGVFVRKHCTKAQQSAEYRRFPPPPWGRGSGGGVVTGKPAPALLFRFVRV